jgi:dethiobiotin synthetase
MISGLFVTGVATAVGKTFVSRGLVRALWRAGRRPVALKPLETGVMTEPADAIALARACARPELALAAGLYRAALPLAPYAAALHTGTAPPALPAIARRIRELATGAGALIVEDAGGLLVPLDARTTMGELAATLELPLLLVARDELGVLSAVLTCAESAHARGLTIAAVVLSAHAPLEADPSPATNARILHERLGLPVLSFPRCADDDDALARAAEAAGLLSLVR